MIKPFNRHDIRVRVSMKNWDTILHVQITMIVPLCVSKKGPYYYGTSKKTISWYQVFQEFDKYIFLSDLILI